MILNALNFFVEEKNIRPHAFVEKIDFNSRANIGSTTANGEEKKTTTIKQQKLL